MAGKNKWQSWFFVLVFVLMFFSFPQPASGEIIVNKYVHQFTVSSLYPEIQACQCSPKSDLIEIKNLGDFSATFNVAIESDHRDWFTLSEDTFEMGPNEVKKVYVYLNAPCDVYGNFQYLIKVRSSFGRERQILKNFNIDKCQNLKMILTSYQDDVGPCEPAKYDIYVENVGLFREDYRLDFGNANDYVNINTTEFSLDSGESRTLPSTITFPCDVYGDKKIQFNAFSQRNLLQASVTKDLNIRRDYDYSVSFEGLHEAGENAVCTQVETDYSFKIKNNANIRNTINIDLNGPSYAGISNDTLVLNPGEEKTVKIWFNPAYEDRGKETITLTLDSELGNIVKKYKFDMDFQSCFKHLLSLKLPEGEKFCSGNLEVPVEVLNDGNRMQEFVIEADGTVNTRIRQPVLKLAESEKGTTVMDVSVPSADGKQSVYVTATNVKNSDLKEGKLFEFESVSDNSCYLVDLGKKKFKINYDDTVIPVIVNHKGLRNGKYDVSYSGEGIAELEENAILFTENGQHAVLHLRLNQEKYLEGDYKGTIKIISEESGQEYNYDINIRLRDKNFLVKLYEYFVYKVTNCIGILYGILLLLVLLGIIGAGAVKTAKEKKKKEHKAKFIKTFTGKLVSFVLILLALLFLVLIIVAQKPSTEDFYQKPFETSYSNLYHEWGMNTRYTMDVSKYFKDPDSDKLSFSASQLEHISIKIEGPKAILVPEHNWYGQEKVVFTATDNKGGFADSDLITLSVVPKKNLGILDYWCYYSNIIILILLILICLALLYLLNVGFVFMKLAERRERKKAEMLKKKRREAYLRRKEAMAGKRKVAAVAGKKGKLQKGNKKRG